MLMVYQVPEIYFVVEKDVLRNWKLFSYLYKEIKLINSLLHGHYSCHIFQTLTD